jgi:hypothetical protein
MNASERPEVLPETDHAREPRTTPSVQTVPQERRSNRQTLPRNPVGPHVPDERASETFVGGAGI